MKNLRLETLDIESVVRSGRAFCGYLSGKGKLGGKKSEDHNSTNNKVNKKEKEIHYTEWIPISNLLSIIDEPKKSDDGKNLIS